VYQSFHTEVTKCLGNVQKNPAHLQEMRKKMLRRATSWSGTERVKESNNEVDEDCEVERHVAPQRDMTAHPAQQRVRCRQK